MDYKHLTTDQMESGVAGILLRSSGFNESSLKILLFYVERNAPIDAAWLTNALADLAAAPHPRESLAYAREFHRRRAEERRAGGGA